LDAPFPLLSSLNKCSFLSLQNRWIELSNEADQLLITHLSIINQLINFKDSVINVFKIIFSIFFYFLAGRRPSSISTFVTAGGAAGWVKFWGSNKLSK